MPTDCYVWGLLPSFLGGSDIKESAYHARDPASIPVSGRSPGKGNAYPFQNSCLRIPWTEEPGSLQSMGPQRVGLAGEAVSVSRMFPVS